MLKLLHIATGKIYILPDQDVMKIKNSDIDGNYKILDAGLTEEKEEQVSKEEAAELASQTPEPLSDEIPDDSVQQPTPPSLKHVNEKEYLEMDLDLDNASAVELKGYCGRLGIKVKSNESKKSMIAKIRETGIVK